MTRFVRPAARKASSSALLDRRERWSSSAMEDARNFRPVLTLAVERDLDRAQRGGKGQNLAGDQEIVVVGTDGMPVDAARGHRHLGHQIRARERDALRGETTQRDSPDDAIRGCNGVPIEKLLEPVGIFVACHGSREPDPEAGVARGLDPRPGALPGSRPTMAVVQLGRRTVEADLQRQPVAWQRSERGQSSAVQQHAVGEHRGRRRVRAGAQDRNDVGQQEWLAAGHEELLEPERSRLRDEPAHQLEIERPARGRRRRPYAARSEEHTSELQSLAYLVCRLLLEKKKKILISFLAFKKKNTYNYH